MDRALKCHVGRLLTCTLLRCYLSVNYTQCVILSNLSILDLALSEVKVLKFQNSAPLSYEYKKKITETKLFSAYL